MNCIENLKAHLRECEPCIKEAFIIEFEELPEEKKYDFDDYNKEQDYLLYCKKCSIYKLIPTDYFNLIN